MWQKDRACVRAWTELNDALCSLERSTNREYTLMLIPRQPDELCSFSQNGKPLEGLSTQEVLDFAMRLRQGPR